MGGQLGKASLALLYDLLGPLGNFPLPPEWGQRAFAF